MNIIAGKYGGLKLDMPKVAGTRPATLLVRGAIFNTLTDLINGKSILDLFAGSGALGFEALSRGGKNCTFVEVSDKALESIRKNAQNFGVSDKISIIKKDTIRFLKSTIEHFDVIFLDPPYADFNEELISYCDKVLNKDGFIVVSCSSKQALSDTIGTLSKQLERIYGDTKIAYFQKKMS